MGLKGLPESSKFRHLFVPGLFQLLRSLTGKTASLPLRRKGGEKSKWFKTGQVTVHKKIILVGGAATLFVQPAFRAYPDILFGFVVNLS